MTDATDQHLYVAKTPNTGDGLFTRRAIGRHETAFVMRGELRFFASRSFDDAYRFENWVGLGRDRWLDPEPPFLYLNHSCEPNLGVKGEREFVALRDIAAGEELTFDYSITEDEVHWVMDCRCGTPQCRGTVGAVQFMPTEALERYLPYVNPFFRDCHFEHVATGAQRRSRR